MFYDIVGCNFMRFTILGSGSSGGVPRIGGVWGACDPLEPKNRRRRSSFLIEKGSGDAVTRVLVDTSPDLREQLLMAGVRVLDGVVYTHSHADHTHGIDDLRAVYFHSKKRIPVFYEVETGAVLLEKFRYCFEQPEDANYVPILDGCLIEAFKGFSIEGAGGTVDLMPFSQLHGNGRSLGFRIGDLVYATDVHAFPDDSLAVMEGAEVLVLDALRYSTHPCHLSVEEALVLIERLAPKRAILTHLHIDLDYQTLKAELPSGVEPAYDGLVIEC